METVGVIALALLFLFFLSLLMSGQAGEEKPSVPFQVIIQPVAEQTEQQGSAFLVMFVVALLLLLAFAMLQAP